jgi:hypothetical protein
VYVINSTSRCWAQAYFEDLILEHAQQLERKKHAEKEGKETCKKENPRVRRQDKPNHIRVRVFDKGCNGYNLVK